MKQQPKMEPACTAACETRELLDAAVAALTRGKCPYSELMPLWDGMHVDINDPECYSRTLRKSAGLAGATDAAFASECRACVIEGLEELAIARREAS